MVNSNDAQSEDFNVYSHAQSLLRYIDNGLGTQKFRFSFYSKCLSAAFQKPLEEQEALRGVFNGVSITLLRASKEYITTGYTDIAILEFEENKVVLTGQIIKRSLGNPGIFFDLNGGDPKQDINEIFSRLSEAYDDFEKEYPDQHDRRSAIVERMESLENPQEIFEKHIIPFLG